MPRSSRESESEPLTLGQALAAHVRLIVWRKSCNHHAEPDIATQVAQQGAGMSVIDWARHWWTIGKPPPRPRRCGISRTSLRFFAPLDTLDRRARRERHQRWDTDKRRRALAARHR